LAVNWWLVDVDFKLHDDLLAWWLILFWLWRKDRKAYIMKNKSWWEILLDFSP
jgi:hypothetical protein